MVSIFSVQGNSCNCAGGAFGVTGAVARARRPVGALVRGEPTTVVTLGEFIPLVEQGPGATPESEYGLPSDRGRPGDRWQLTLPYRGIGARGYQQVGSFLEEYTILKGFGRLFEGEHAVLAQVPHGPVYTYLGYGPPVVRYG
jgi:hypothetical protein